MFELQRLQLEARMREESFLIERRESRHRRRPPSLRLFSLTYHHHAFPYPFVLGFPAIFIGGHRRTSCHARINPRPFAIHAADSLAAVTRGPPYDRVFRIDLLLLCP